MKSPGAVIGVIGVIGVKRAYKFKPSDSRILEEQALERQVNAAAFMPTTEEDKAAAIGRQQSFPEVDRGNGSRSK
jgi:hypothetical protein